MNSIYLLYLLPILVYSEKIIKNVNLPACRNCIHYQPDIYNNDFASYLNKCDKFGDKNIVTDKITYDFADQCRNDDSKCGKEGKYFVVEPNINMKILKYSLIKNIPNGIFIVTIGAYIFSTIYVASHPQ
jgi:hypothetical protein